MKALLLGSIGTLADTSELQRAAFNAAFREHDLPWSWDRGAYRHMLREAGGRKRIADQASSDGREVDADAVHATKSRIFQDYLAEGRAEDRPGILQLIADTRDMGLPVGLVTTTERANVDRLLAALGLDRDAFAVITTREDVAASKPARDCYALAAASLGLPPEDCLAIEDNPDGVRAALRAGMACIAWPNENTRDHDYDGAQVVTGDIRGAFQGDPVAAE